MRRMAMGVILAVLVLGARAAAANADKQRDYLDYGLWNNRVQMLYELGEEGRGGLPLLIYSSDDADWQVRLTAVHFMGKVGPVAAPALGEIVRVEPCPRVRVAALRWLKGMGPEGREVLNAVMSPEDEREMEALPDRYGTERMGKPIVIDAPGGVMTPQFFHRGLDLRVCASSEYANRRKRRRGPQRERGPAPVSVQAPVRREQPARPDAFEPVDTPSIRLTSTGEPVRPGEKPPERLPEAPPAAPVALIEPQIPIPRLERTERMPSSEPHAAAAPAAAASRVVRTPESFPPGGPGFGRPEPSSPVVRYGAEPEIRPLPSSAPRAPLPAGEIMPAAGPGIYHEPVEAGLAGIVDDAGTGKPENDPIPELIRRLSSAEARIRARAADELGKRGKAALPAVPALRRALKDRDRRVRASAVLALGGVAYSVDGVADDLRRALRDKHEDVRFSAVIALERLK